MSKYYFGKPKDDRRIFTEQPSRWEHALDCAVFLAALIFIYAVAAYWSA